MDVVEFEEFFYCRNQSVKIDDSVEIEYFTSHIVFSLVVEFYKKKKIFFQQEVESLEIHNGINEYCFRSFKASTFIFICFKNSLLKCHMKKFVSICHEVFIKMKEETLKQLCHKFKLILQSILFGKR